MRLGEEIREITTWLNSGPFRDLLSIEPVFAARQNDLQHALLQHKPHILHFSGHGSESGIKLEDDSGNSSDFEFEQLAQLLAAFHDNLRLVVLNACNSAHRANAILQPVDYVIGMNHKILDRSAINFASAFYMSVGFNRTIRECFLSGISALRSSGIPQAHIPVLLSNEGRDPHRTNPLTWITSQDGKEDRQDKSAGSAIEPGTGPIQLDLLLLPPNTNKARRWRYALNQKEESFESTDEQLERLKPESMWQLLAAETSNFTKGFRGARMTPDIFLILHDDLILSLYPEQTLENIIHKVCQAARGSNVYLICDREIPFNTLYQRKKYQSGLERWFQTLVDSGVTDLIEIPKGQESAIDPRTLRKYANNSQDRRQRLRKLVSAEDWIVELRPQALTLKLFLERFTEGDVGLVNAKNLAVFYDQKPDNGVEELLVNARRRNGTGKWFIATHTSSNIDICDLEKHWKEESNKKALECFDEIFEFHGMFEWLYAICRLHQAAQLARLTSPNVAAKAMF